MQHKIHDAYGGGECEESSELVPGEIDYGCPDKWFKAGTVVACLGPAEGEIRNRYAYDPELLIKGSDTFSTHVVWAGPGRGKGGHREDGSGWRYVNIIPVNL